MSEKAASQASPQANPYAAAVDRMRETAKWIITIFGGLGALLIAGTQLSNVGKLKVNNAVQAIWKGIETGRLEANSVPDVVRLCAALLGGLVALAAIARIIWAATNVMITGEVTLAQLEEIEQKNNRAPESVFNK
jgi:hypothetical protein